MTSISHPLGAITAAPIEGVLPMKVQPATRFTWKPSDEIRHLLPPDFSLEFFCWVGQDSVRRFAPTVPLGKFIPEAFLAGLAIQLGRFGFDPRVRFSYCAMLTLYQLAPRLREHLDRRFVRKEDFAASRGQDVLPEHFGTTSAGEGSRWTVEELEKEGRDAATKTGRTSPDSATCFHLGLLEAARRNPLPPSSLSEDEARQLVRLGLFDLGPVPGEADAAKTEEVIGRVLDALMKHQDYGTEEFNRWFFDHVDNLVHQVSKKKTGGTISREVVRQALLEEVFRSYTYVGDCVHLLMMDVRDALPDPLNERELGVFRFLYLKQRYLGGLPLLLLRDRFDFLDEAIQTLLVSSPDQDNIGALLRLLEYYGAMVSNKRQVDREHKRRGRHRNKSGGIAIEVSLEDWDSPLTPEADSSRESGARRSGSIVIQQSAWSEQFEEIAEVIRKKRRVRCKCKTTEHWHAIVLHENDREAVLSDGCQVCEHHEPDLCVSIEELKAIAKKIRKEPTA